MIVIINIIGIIGEEFNNFLTMINQTKKKTFFNAEFEDKYIKNLSTEAKWKLFRFLKKRNVVQKEEDYTEKDRKRNLCSGNYFAYVLIAPNGQKYVGKASNNRSGNTADPMDWMPRPSNNRIDQLLKIYPWEEWKRILIAKDISNEAALALREYFVGFFDSHKNGLNIKQYGEQSEYCQEAHAANRSRKSRSVYESSAKLNQFF